MVLQKVLSVPDPTGTEGIKGKESLSSARKSTLSLLIHSYQPLVSYPQSVTWSKPSQFELRFPQFLDIPRRIYVSVPFLEVLKEAPTYMKFLREALFKKGKLEKVSVALIGYAN